MYFDAVLDKSLKPIFNGSEEEVKEWLQDDDQRLYAETHGAVVCLGKTMTFTSIDNYLANA